MRLLRFSDILCLPDEVYHQFALFLFDYCVLPMYVYTIPLHTAVVNSFYCVLTMYFKNTMRGGKCVRNI
nr:MAG TPA: hypothetical protein [Caudoviricetes sp.]